ncbi:hypothetical protein PVAP13_4KG384600 [Panicum virgatum]|uniref:Uncharacterized protein n=1 Tax=Panicum virgatum TaxID=38727 RepID=A0A8T0TZ44_PANVG|nr:hypothetical protein PVAP13_4KG384600 [Panicum virgatum]
MLEAKKLPPPSRLQPPSAPAPSPLPYHHHHYGTFPPPSQPPPVGGATYHASSQIGFGSQGVVAFPGTVQQQIFVEGVPVQEPPLPFCGIGIGSYWGSSWLPFRGMLVPSFYSLLLWTTERSLD